MDLDGKRKWTKTHRYCTDIFETQCNPSANGEAKSINSCGNPNFSDLLSVPVDVSFRHIDPTTGSSASSLKLEFGGDLSMGACSAESTCAVQGYGCSTHGLCINSGASWGLDDVRVYVM